MKILFVAQPDSAHTARWIAQLDGLGWDLRLFSSNGGRPGPELPPITMHTYLPEDWPEKAPKVRQVPIVPWRFKRGREWARIIYGKLRPRLAVPPGRLADLIDRLQPDIVHTLEMQHAGYLMEEARRLLRRPVAHSWFYSCWGNDILFFRNDQKHAERIANVIRSCDYFTADCERDLALIKSYGPTGKAIPVFPTGGGYRLEAVEGYRTPGPVSSRRIIALKGYHSDQWTGRALVGLQALHQCANDLLGYEIVIYHAAPCVRFAAEYVTRVSGLKITVLSELVRNENILQLLGKSRIGMGISVGDGTPNTMLEAMIMGAFPIQTDTADTKGWITPGQNGIIVPPNCPDAIAAAVRRAVYEDRLVDEAAETNARIAAQRLDFRKIQDEVVQLYKNIAAKRWEQAARK